MIALGEIAISPLKKRSRALQPDKVEAIAESFAKRGQLQDIIVTPCPGHGYWLVAGEHRYEAAKLLKWAAIGCTVIPEGTTPEEIELIELDENLIRAELSEAEKTGITLRRKEIYDKLHPETTKRGRHSPKAKGKGKDEAGSKAPEEPSKTFAEDAAAKTGEGKSTIKKRTARGKKLVELFGEGVTADIANTSLDSVGEMDALLELGKETALPLIAQAKAGAQVSAKKVIADRKKAAEEEAERKSKKAADVIAKADAAERRSKQVTVRAAPAKDEKAAAQEARERWQLTLQSFYKATVDVSYFPAEDLGVGDAALVEFLVTVLTKLIAGHDPQKKESVH
jgi:ParB/RepB/Spo0J family partition protein